jgi:hypothetical protein
MLAVIVAAIAAFLVVMALLAIAVIAERGQLQRIRFDTDASPFTLTLTEAFDPDHAILWGTQIPALQFIRKAGIRGVSYHRLFCTYQRASQRYPELYEGCSFAQWLYFLQSTELITVSTYRVRITDTGCYFLDCVAEVAMAA